jgi:hypothetical protein
MHVVYLRVKFIAVHIFKIKKEGIRNWVARFFLVYDTKTGNNVPNEHKMNQIVIKYP